MNSKAQQAAIAKACGWTDLHEDKNYGLVGNLPGDTRTIVPDYPDDLNAMHEAEVAIEERGLWGPYISELKFVCGEPQFSEYSRETHVGASSAKRAEAFLRTFRLRNNTK